MSNYLDSVISSLNSAGEGIDAFNENKMKTAKAAQDQAAIDKKNKDDEEKKAKTQAFIDEVRKLTAEQSADTSGYNAAVVAKPQIDAAGAAASQNTLDSQYNTGKTLNTGDRRTIYDEANAKYPSLGPLPGRAALDNLAKLRTGGSNMKGISDLSANGYTQPPKPISTPESIQAGADASGAMKRDIQSKAASNVDYGKLSLQASSRLSPYMADAGLKESDVPLLGTLSDKAKSQDANKLKADELKAKYGEDNQGDKAFDPESDDYKVAQYITDHKIPPSEWKGLWSGLGKTAAKKSRVMSTILQIDPNYDWVESSTGFKGAMSHAGKAGTLTPDLIQKGADQTGANERAKLAPDIVSGKIEKTARAQTATVLDKQRMAAQRAISTLDDAYNKSQGNYDNIPEWMYRDIASDYAKILVSTGQIAEGSVDKVMQKSAKGAIVQLWNWGTGDTKTTAPGKVLSLLHNRIKALNTDLDKQYNNQVTGQNNEVNSDESTNPLKPIPSSAKTDFRAKYGY
jgi:hypothetical protein